jgi:uncharacterized protein (DUF305 family)
MKLAVAVIALAWSTAAAAQPMADMPGMAKPAPSAAAPGAKPGGAFVPMGNGSTEAYNDSMSKMMSGMNAPYSGDADRDFVTHMEPHHQGAIDMAEIELKYGSDPKMKQLAARIIAAQQHEIAFMQSWLEKHPAKPIQGKMPPGAH